MRSIRKQGQGPYQLNRSHADPPTTPSTAHSRWGSFGYKPELLQQLLGEQYQLCCYSEIRPDLERLGFHIEHVENKSQHPQRTFDYKNLAACALNSVNDLSSLQMQGVEAFGGHASGKSASVDMTLFVSCHQQDCARFFAYLSDGRVVPADALTLAQQAQAQYTIDLLNLNSPYLQELRQRWRDELEELIDKHLEDGDDLMCLAGIDLIPRGSSLSQFFSMNRNLFGDIAEQVLAQHAPELL